MARMQKYMKKKSALLLATKAKGLARLRSRYKRKQTYLFQNPANKQTLIKVICSAD